MSTEYKPIDCNLYDHFEIHAKRGTWLDIEVDDDDGPRHINTRISNLETKDKKEFLVNHIGERIRLDQVKSMLPMQPGKHMIAHFLDKMDYNYWANHKVIAHILKIDDIPAKVTSWVSHILNAHHLWNKRILGQEPEYSLWDEHAPSMWHDINEKAHEETYRILSSTDTDTSIAYQTLEGYEFSNTVGEIMYHIINHSSYHGGQIAHELRCCGHEALPTDYIFYKQ